MSEENVEFVKGLYAGAAQMDRDELLAALPALIEQSCDPEIEWVENPRRADARTYRGHPGVLESWTRWHENFERYGAELEEVRDCGDRVLAVAREEASGKKSGVPVTARLYQVLTFRKGKVVRYEEFYDEADALEAVGMTE